MIVEKIDPDKKCFDDYSLDGNNIIIGNDTVNLENEEQDQEVRITFGICYGNIHRGLMPGCIYAADIIIPPRKYEVIENTETENSDTAEEDSVREIKMESMPIPLNIDSVILRLWPVVDEANIEIENEVVEEENVIE
jgi:hypothetical protein